MSELNEILFTKGELEQIEGAVMRNPLLRNPFVLNFTKFHTDVVKVSQKWGLIFAKGNEFTGFEHIQQRHDNWMSVPKWMPTRDEFGNDYLRLQNQSLFPKALIPFFDYAIIADAIFSNENYNPEKNKRPNVFDLYSGAHTHEDGNVERYDLLLYKGTKVVHTLFPKSIKHNPKRVEGFNLVKGGVWGKWFSSTSNLEIYVPYLNYEKKVKYVLIIKRFPIEAIEKIEIQVNDKTEKPFKSILISERTLDPKLANQGLKQRELFQLQFADLRVFEREILKIERLNSA